MGRIFAMLFLGLFYVVGLGMLWHGLESAKRSLQASRWPSTVGTITATALHESTDSDGDTTYQARVQYRYRVGGREYTGSRLAFGYTSTSNVRPHNEILHKLQTATSVRVRYKPQDPATSTLSYGIHRSIQFILAFALTWLTFVSGFTVIWWIGSQSDEVLRRNLEVVQKPDLY
jgi:hypothetical protein